jgi:hypothetical protein
VRAEFIVCLPEGWVHGNWEDLSNDFDSAFIY